MNIQNIHQSSSFKSSINGKVIDDKEEMLNIINNEGEYAFRDKNNVYYKPLNKNQLYALLNPKNRVSIVDSLERLGGVFPKKKKKVKKMKPRKTLKKYRKRNKKGGKKNRRKTLKS